MIGSAPHSTVALRVPASYVATAAGSARITCPRRPRSGGKRQRVGLREARSRAGMTGANNVQSAAGDALRGGNWRPLRNRAHAFLLYWEEGTRLHDLGPHIVGADRCGCYSLKVFLRESQGWQLRTIAGQRHATTAYRMSRNASDISRRVRQQPLLTTAVCQ